jgi:hypothetical protein
MQLNTYISEKQAIINLREAAALMAKANVKIQAVFDASEALQEMHDAIEDMCAILEMEADELQSLGT